LLFVVCAINLWSRIRKEMKNSIVENIRELWWKSLLQLFWLLCFALALA
jgi:hypothetical protein